jgi:hypothetical protein
MLPGNWFDDEREAAGDWRHRDRRGAGRRAIGDLWDFALRCGLWASGCLALAAQLPPVLAAPVLRELLLLCAVSHGLLGLFRGERASLESFNRQDLALVLVGLAMVAGFFVDAEALSRFAVMQTEAAAG